MGDPLNRPTPELIAAREAAHLQVLKDALGVTHLPVSRGGPRKVNPSQMALYMREWRWRRRKLEKLKKEEGDGKGDDTGG